MAPSFDMISKDIIAKPSLKKISPNTLNSYSQLCDPFCVGFVCGKESNFVGFFPYRNIVFPTP